MWAWIIIMLILLLLNFIITAKIFSMPKLYSAMTSMTAILTPSMYPTMEATHISILAKFHILNTVAVSGVIVIAALIRKLSFKIMKNFIITKVIYKYS